MPHLHVGISEAISQNCKYEYSAFDYHHIRIKRQTPFYIVTCDLARLRHCFRLLLFPMVPLPAPTFHAALPSASSLGNPLFSTRLRMNDNPVRGTEYISAHAQSCSSFAVIAESLHSRHTKIVPDEVGVYLSAEATPGHPAHDLIKHPLGRQSLHHRPRLERHHPAAIFLTCLSTYSGAPLLAADFGSFLSSSHLLPFLHRLDPG
jgi:hypothetical protein